MAACKYTAPYRRNTLSGGTSLSELNEIFIGNDFSPKSTSGFGCYVMNYKSGLSAHVHGWQIPMMLFRRGEDFGGVAKVSGEATQR